AGCRARALSTVKLAASDLAALAGRYKIDNNDVLSLTVRGGRVYRKRPFGEEFEILPVSRNELAEREHAVRYRVERSGDSVSAIETPFEEEKTTARRMAPGERIPSDFLAENDFAGALAAWRRLLEADPKDPAAAEPRLNQLGYSLASDHDFVRAIAVLRINTELYPASSNTYDSLGEVYLMSGDRANALESARKGREVLPNDAKTDPGLKNRLRRNAEKLLASGG